MPHACPWHDGTTKWRKQDSTHLMLSQPTSMSIMMKYSTSTTTVHQMRSLNHSTLKSNSSERISGELLTRSFSYSVLLTYLPIPTKILLTKIMLEKLRISLIFINLVLLKSLSLNRRMHNLYTKFVRILEICKQFSNNLVNDQGNIVRCGPVPKFSDLEVVALSLAAESESIDSEK